MYLELKSLVSHYLGYIAGHCQELRIDLENKCLKIIRVESKWLEEEQREDICLAGMSQ